MTQTKKEIYMWPSYWSRPVAHGSCGAISSNSVYATRAGLEILKQGGNAFDAAVAVSLALSVVEPHHSGLGGGCFSLLYAAKENKFVALDGRGIAPKAAGPDLFIKDGEVQDEWKDLGGQSVAVPGLLRTLEEVLEKYGTLTWKDVAAPAIRLAEEGFGTGYTESLTMEDDSVRRKRRLSAAFRKLYLKPDGSQYRFGEKQTNPEIGKLLEQVAEKGADAFYTGSTAQQMVDLINARGGCFVLEDFTEYRPKYRQVLHTSYHGTDVVSFGPPSGGCAVLEMLNILETRDVRKTGQNTAATIHALAEAMKLGFADRSQALGDPDFVQVDTDRLVSKKFAEERAAFMTEEAGEFAAAENIAAKDYPGNTSHFVVMDKEGNAFSQTQTVRDWFGCGIVVDGLGFVLNNAMSDFSAEAGAITSQGLSYGMANSIAGGKTPLSSMAPTMVCRDGKPFLAIGAAGGPRIITGIVQGIVNGVDFGLTPERLVGLPYIHCQTRKQGLEVELGISEDTLDLLRKRGHTIVKVPSDQAMSTMLNSVMCQDGEYYAAGTQRVDGCGGALLPDGHVVLEGVSQE
ncbi:gamma-glutamyltransferase [uncultured Acidaminococcus sp.]|uniref:gamma-glutamyltransferase n=1 Tax=uncultured Acidaminococcus sp. TaxID=352152 RepID=UPI00294312D8|nr:gamma-glutamyltransferase [uncultured Acidaminococcus sp.]